MSDAGYLMAKGEKRRAITGWIIGFGVLALLLFAVWAYLMSAKTRAAALELKGIESAILKEREAIQMLRAEWAYLNRPERLRHLVEMNFPSLGLMQISPANYGDPRDIPMPPKGEGPAEPFVDQDEIDAILAEIIRSEALPRQGESAAAPLVETGELAEALPRQSESQPAHEAKSGAGN